MRLRRRIKPRRRHDVEYKRVIQWRERLCVSPVMLVSLPAAAAVRKVARTANSTPTILSASLTTSKINGDTTRTGRRPVQYYNNKSGRLTDRGKSENETEEEEKRNV